MKVISKNGNKYDIQYQQYISGLYIAVYKDKHIFDQLCFDGNISQFKDHLKQNGFKILS